MIVSSLRLRWILYYNWLVAENAVLVSMCLDLVLEAFCVEDVRRVASQTAYVIAAPDALKADRTIEVFAFLEEEGSIWPPAEFDYDPCVLAWVALDVPQDVQGEEHQE